jgi:thioredoxin-dependent peroxiredoxin
MRKLVIGLAFAALAAPSMAALPVGTAAPDFTTSGALAGKPFKLDLKQQLKHGPVVLYFFPKAFTQGCTMEAHAFSDASAQFKKLGAQVIGMSRDDLPTLEQFSVRECRNNFPVATATPQIADEYQVAWAEHPNVTTRTSYVIGPNGKVVMVYDNLDWSQHVQRTLAAVKALKGK